MIRKRRQIKNDRAVSEALGFIIIFGIMLTGIGMVTLYGYPVLVQEQQNSNIRNMERNMIVLQSDINSLTMKYVPYKETALQVSGGTLKVIPPGEMPGQNFTLTNSSTTLINNFVPGGLVYQADDGNTVVCLENGAVHKRYWNDLTGSAMISNPRWFFDSSTSTLVVYLMEMNSSKTLAQTGIGTVRMIVSPLPTFSRSEDFSISPEVVTVHYQPSPENNFKKAWQNYFGSFSENQYSGSDAKLEIHGVKKLIVKAYSIQILSL